VTRGFAAGAAFFEAEVENMPLNWMQRFLLVYSGLVTVAFCIGAYFSFEHRSGYATFDRIRVHRIDIVEPNGTPRLILANRAAYPGSFFHGAEIPRADRRDSAGMLMMNDEGTEDGGFIWGGLTIDGKPMNFSHLSFDQYEQDQTLTLETSLENNQRFAGIRLNDVPNIPITPQLVEEYEGLRALPEGSAKDQAMAAFSQRFPASHRRAALERTKDDSVALTLSDTQGHIRLRAMVSADGQPVIEFIDGAGHVTKTLTATSGP
jgi:hypothetical protein